MMEADEVRKTAWVAEARLTSHEAECARRYAEATQAITRLHDRIDRGQWLLTGALLTGIGTLGMAILNIILKLK